MGAPWLEFLVYPLIVLVIIGMARAAVQTYSKRMVERHDAASLGEFLFDQDVNPRTHVPGKKGWTTLVDDQLHELKAGQEEQKSLLEEVHTTVQNLGTHIIANQEK